MERLRVEFYMNDVFMLSSIKTERGTAYPLQDRSILLYKLHFNTSDYEEST